MRRRAVLAGLAALGAAGLLASRPRDRGAPYEPYFADLNRLLKEQGPWRPCLLLDLDRLNLNIAHLRANLQPQHAYRLVAKSLPSLKLMDHVLRATGSRRLMAFHQPFLNAEAESFPDADILLGKPLPAGSAAIFYERHRGAFDPARQLQWLIDGEPRLHQYLELAKAQGLKLRLNLELDVGLRRGGFREPAEVIRALDAIAAQAEHASFSGFMGYDPHVVKLPAIAGSRAALFARASARYQAVVDAVRQQRPALWRDDLTLNGAGSPTFALYHDDRLRNDLSLGSALVKPSDFDLDTLSGFVPALFIASPVLKALEGLHLPELPGLSRLMSGWDPNRRRSHFIYGGRWLAQPVAPAGLQMNALYGFSSNQELINGSETTGLAADDHIFLRPTQSEALMLQFGDLLVVRGGALVARWPVL